MFYGDFFVLFLNETPPRAAVNVMIAAKVVTSRRLVLGWADFDFCVGTGIGCEIMVECTHYFGD